jgi:hypothetical protein
MKKYEVKIGYTITMDIDAKSKKEAEEIAWQVYDEQQPEPAIYIKEK